MRSAARRSGTKSCSRVREERHTKLLRTPEDKFQDLHGFPFAAHYVEINGARVHYIDEGAGETLLMLHGEPSWSYLYRKMVPPLVEAGYRAVAPDFIGFGRSDKFAEMEDYSYQMHVDTLWSFIQQLNLRDVTFVMQDWGGLIGLRVAAEHPERVARLVVMNTGLPAGEAGPMPPDDEGSPDNPFFAWRRRSRETADLPVGQIIQEATFTDLPPEVVAAYDAPFPDVTYKAGARIWPSLVPMFSDMPGVEENKRAWEVYRTWQKPTLVMFSDRDPITRGGERRFRSRIPAAAREPEITIHDAGHFLQEDKGEEIAENVIAFMRRNPLPA
jgi:haloalkane dehalogenase